MGIATIIIIVCWISVTLLIFVKVKQDIKTLEVKLISDKKKACICTAKQESMNKILKSVNKKRKVKK